MARRHLLATRLQMFKKLKGSCSNCGSYGGPEIPAPATPGAAVMAQTAAMVNRMLGDGDRQKLVQQLSAAGRWRDQVGGKVPQFIAP